MAAISASVRGVRGSVFAVSLVFAFLGGGRAIAGDGIFGDGFESGAVCNWSSFVSPTIPGGCVIDDVCYAPGATDPENQGCRTCNPAQSQTAWTIVNEGGGCSDGDACTTGDTCDAGLCQPTGVDSCDDGFGCTNDSCDSGTGCSHDPQDTFCDDLLACTLNFCDLGSGCELTIVAGNCLIEGTCYADGDPDPANACRYCDADANNEAFSLQEPGFVCGAGSCQSGTIANLPDTCDVAGQCVDGGTASCPPYVCSGSACLTSCDEPTDCSTGNYCSGTFQCLPKKANGQACSAADNCISNHCVDGFCCESACGGVCESCNQAGRLGFCDAVPNGTDPGNECTQDPVASCDQDGFCSGSRTCRLYAASTACTAPACVGSPFAQASDPADLCNGTGTCVVTPQVDCGNYLCNSGTGLCRTSCQFDFHCDAGFICDTGSQTCVPF